MRLIDQNGERTLRVSDVHVDVLLSRLQQHVLLQVASCQAADYAGPPYRRTLNDCFHPFGTDCAY